MFENGVKFYTQGKAKIHINFPENYIACCYCPFCRAEKELGRYWCRLTNDMIYNPMTSIGDNCPIEFNKEE